MRMDTPQHPLEILDHPVESMLKCRPPADQDIVMPRAHCSGLDLPHDFTQAPANPVSLDRRTDLTRHSEADAHGSAIPPLANLQHEGGCGCLGSACGSQEIPAVPQSLHGDAGLPRETHALSRLRPRERRAATTLRPPLVAMRARKPCRRLRTSLLG